MEPRPPPPQPLFNKRYGDFRSKWSNFKNALLPDHSYKLRLVMNDLWLRFVMSAIMTDAVATKPLQFLYSISPFFLA